MANHKKVPKPIVSVTLWGTFSPTKIEADTGLLFDSKHEIGDIAKQGEHKGTPYPHAAASLYAPTESGETVRDCTYWLLKRLEPHIEDLKQAGVTGGNLIVSYTHGDMGVINFEPELLARLVDLDLHLQFLLHYDPMASNSINSAIGSVIHRRNRRLNRPRGS